MPKRKSKQLILRRSDGSICHDFDKYFVKTNGLWYYVSHATKRRWFIQPIVHNGEITEQALWRYSWATAKVNYDDIV